MPSKDKLSVQMPSSTYQNSPRGSDQQLGGSASGYSADEEFDHRTIKPKKKHGTKSKLSTEAHALSSSAASSNMETDAKHQTQTSPSKGGSRRRHHSPADESDLTEPGEPDRSTLDGPLLVRPGLSTIGKQLQEPDRYRKRFERQQQEAARQMDEAMEWEPTAETDSPGITLAAPGLSGFARRTDKRQNKSDP